MMSIPTLSTALPKVPGAKEPREPEMEGEGASKRSLTLDPILTGTRFELAEVVRRKARHYAQALFLCLNALG